jgi:hypothetical protein
VSDSRSGRFRDPVTGRSRDPVTGRFPEEGPPRVLAVADSDSYLKWAAGMLDSLPAPWSRRLLVLRSPITPSPAQRAAATAGSLNGNALSVVPMTEVLREVDRSRADVVLLACTGPVVDALAWSIRRPWPGLGRRQRRVVLVSGLPGLSIPPTPAAWLYRSQADLFVVHSRRELVEFGQLGTALGASGQVALSHLPFLGLSDPAPRPARDPRAGGRVLFAAQAKVPRDVESRRRILRALDRLARERPDLLPVVKVRARAGEQQTHRERHRYESLWAALVAAGEVSDGAVVFEDGPMGRHLEDAAALVTVSSTAALEAMAAGVPVLILSDFGVDEAMLNLVFTGSGCFGTLDDLVAGSFHQPDPAWLEDNYFHPTGEQDWVRQTRQLVGRARSGDLPDQPPLLTSPTDLRRRRRARWRLTLPPPILQARLAALRVSRRSRRRLRRALGLPVAGRHRRPVQVAATPDYALAPATEARADDLYAVAGVAAADIPAEAALDPQY